MDISEMKDRLPPWAKILLAVVFVVGPTCTATVTLVKTYYEVKTVKSKANSAAEKTSASHETLAPAVGEMQEILNGAMEWADLVDQELEECAAHKDRLDRLDLYMEILSSRKGFPEVPELIENEPYDPEWYEAIMSDPYPLGALPSNPVSGVVASAVAPTLPTLPELPKAHKKSLRPVPMNVNKAQDYQQARAKERCAPDDPLCGSGGLE